MPVSSKPESVAAAVPPMPPLRWVVLVQPDPKGSDKSTRWEVSLAVGRRQSFVLASSPCAGLAFDIPSTPATPAAQAAASVRVGRLAFFSSDSPDQPILVLDCDPTKSSAILSASAVKLDLVLPTLLLEAGSRYRPHIKAELQAALQEAGGSPLLRTSGWGGLGQAERDAVQSGLADTADRTGAYGTAGDAERQIRDGGLLYALAETISNVEREAWSTSGAPGFGEAIAASLPQLRPDGRPPGRGVLSWSRLWSSLVRMHLVIDRGKPPEVIRADRFELRIARRATGASEPRPRDGDLLTTRLDLGGQKLWVVERQPPGWASRAGTTTTPCQSVLLVKGISTPSVLAVWSGLLARYHASLRSIRNERPVSLLPRLLPLAPSPTWTLAVRAENTRLTTPRLTIGGEEGETSPGLVPLKVAATALQIHPKIGNPPGSPGLELGQFTLAQDGSRLEQILAEITTPHSIPAAALPQWLFSLTLTPTLNPTAPTRPKPDPAEVRLGAFDLTLRGKLGEPHASKLFLAVIETAIHVESTLYLPVTEVKPGGQDRAARDAAPPPVLVPMATPAEPASPFQLQAIETSLPGDRQKVIFKLTSQSGSTPARKLVVIDTEPFSIMLVTMPALVPQDANSLLAEWSSDDPEGGTSWRVAAQAEGYDILLPPSAIGESAIRDTRNWPNDKHRFADFRFGQNASLRVFTSYRRNLVGLTPPPFNTRMLFGNALQRLPGAPVAQAELELLYGLRASISNRPDILATELTADLGILPILDVELPGDSPGFENLWGKKTSAARSARVKQARELNKRVASGFRSRLAVLSLHPQKPDGVPAEQRIEAGVDFLLRTKVLKTTIDLTSEPEKLDGGATSGFESQNILDEVLRTPKGNGGELFGVHLSPLGAWGAQRAFFASRKSVIASRAGQGRTHFYSIERVGRIGVFWNRCKHVIIYERTVQAADQFAPGQPNEEGRPLLRKVREYVEVMQATRRFPEQPTAPARRGCVEALICRRVIIPVDSNWGQDIPNGWRLPLWNPAVLDSPHDRRVYPKPHLELQMAGDAAAATGPGFAPIDTPEKLVFYTSTRPEDTDDTDAWAPVAGIDYALGPVPTAPAVRTHDPHDKDGMLPSDRPMLAGLEPFTFGLDRAAPVASNVVAARAEKPVTALLSNVTLMRPAPDWTKRGAADLLKGARLHADQLREQIGVMRVALARMAAAPDQTSAILQAISVNGKEVADPAFADHAIADYLEFAKKLRDEPVDVGAEISKEIKAAAAALGTRFQGEVGPEIQGLMGRVAVVAMLSGPLKQQLINDVKLLGDRLLAFAQQASPPLTRLRSALPSPARLKAATTMFRLELIRLQTQANQAEAAASSMSLSTMAASLSAVRDTLLGQFDTTTASMLQPMYSALPMLREKLMPMVASVRHGYDDALTPLAASAATLRRTNGTIPDQVTSAVKGIRDGIGAALGALDAVDAAWEAVGAQIVAARTVLEQQLQNLGHSPTLTRMEQFAKELRIVSADLPVGFADSLQRLLAADWIPPPGSAATLVATFLAPAHYPDVPNLAEVETYRTRLAATLGSLSPEQIRDQMRAKLDRFEQDAAAIEHRLADSVQNAALGLAQAVNSSLNATLKSGADTALQMVRAFGDAPVVPGLAFNRSQVAYIMLNDGALAESVKTTPMTALYDRAGDALKGLGLRVPTDEIAARLLPKFDDFKISDLFPDIAGIRLDKLFPDLDLPPGASNKVSVRHGIDTQTQRAWIDAEVTPLAIGGSAPLFDFAAFSMKLGEGVFTAHAKLGVDTYGTVSREAAGQVRGNWEVAFGGHTLITFLDTPLDFNQSGKLNFDIRPDRVKLAPELNFIDEFLKSAGPLMADDTGGKGLFTVGVIQDGLVPSGVECMLTLPVPDLTYGTFGISGLVFVTGVQLRVYPDFSITVHAALGAASHPFTITIFILGGSGWIQCWGRYTPKYDMLEAHVSIAIGASATLGFNFGPIHGIVQLFVGFKAALDFKSSGPASMSVSLIMIARGQVDVAGLITAALMLMLEMRVEQGGAVVGEGTAYFSIRLGPFFTFRVAQSVSYHLVGPKSESKSDPNQAAAHANAHAGALV